MLISHQGRNIHVYRSQKNDRPVLVLIFGFSMTVQDWIDFGYMERLQDHFSVIAIEPVGHGNSSCPTESEAYQLPLITSDIIFVLNHLQISKMIVWGYSLGAKIALSLASTERDRIRGYILGGFELNSVVPTDDIVSQTLQQGGPAWRRLWEQMTDLPPSAAHRLERVNTQALIALRQAEGNWQPLDELPPTISDPVLLYAGETCFYRETVKQMSSLFADSRYIEHPDANHFQLIPKAEWICKQVIASFAT